MVDLNYLNSSPQPAQEKLIANAFAMFGAVEVLDFQDFELLILGIENVFDKSQPPRTIKDGRKLLDVSTPENFKLFHKKLLPWLDLKLFNEAKVRKTKQITKSNDQIKNKKLSN
jgi:hypothetical protein